MLCFQLAWSDDVVAKYKEILTCSKGQAVRPVKLLGLAPQNINLRLRLGRAGGVGQFPKKKKIELMLFTS